QPTDNAYLPVIRLHNIVFSPDYARDGTLFSSSWTHLLKSNDRGATWSQHVVGDPPPDTKLRQFIVALSPRYATDQTVFLGSLQGEVFISTEGGEEGTFVALGSVGGPVRSLAVGPDYPDDPTLWAGTRNGTFVSIDGGRTWEASGPAGVSLLAVSPDYGRDGTVFSGSEAGLWVTRDRGETWSIVAGDLIDQDSLIEAVAVSPAFADDGTVLVSVRGVGLLRSTDGGETFGLVAEQLNADSHLIADFSRPSAAPIQFSPAFAEDRTIYAYAAETVLRSTDGGDTFDEVELPDSAEFDSLTAQGATTQNGSTSPWTWVALAVAVVAAVAFVMVERRR
ncbi:MAG: WD40/YVTN/BNR-like repeat-containing protein, partial [Acidimicrobiales bacterium]